MTSQGRKLHSRGGMEHLPRCISLVAEAGRRAGMSARQREVLESAVRDAYLAIVEAGQRDSRRAPIEVEAGWNDEAVTVRLTHGGSSLEKLFDRRHPDPRVAAMCTALDEVMYVKGDRHGHQLSLCVRVKRAARPAARRTAGSR
ncbi:MAG: hypothetical protein HZB25_03620 [Candidatus Eisenbacteria bacterium]|nr:hypothetical protein [Candidatus Eisenbacteria bacterium]